MEFTEIEQIKKILRKLLPEYEYAIHTTGPEDYIAIRKKPNGTGTEVAKVYGYYFCYIFAHDLAGVFTDTIDNRYQLSDPDCIDDLVCDIILADLYFEYPVNDRPHVSIFNLEW